MNSSNEDKDAHVVEQLLSQQLLLDYSPQSIRLETEQLLGYIPCILFTQASLTDKLETIQNVRQLLTSCLVDIGIEDRQIQTLTDKFIAELPRLKADTLADVEAAYRGDPAAKSYQEIVTCYPSIKTLLNHRLANLMITLKVPIIPRLISSISYADTGIDINPGAIIGSGCFIDHGSGVVIGETAVVGKNCIIYQGVTLGAKSFPKNQDGSVVKELARHPIVEDRVTIYAGATILGRITIGHDAIIGGNVWITSDVPASSVITQTKYQYSSFNNGAGI